MTALGRIASQHWAVRGERMTAPELAGSDLATPAILCLRLIVSALSSSDLRLEDSLRRIHRVASSRTTMCQQYLCIICDRPLTGYGFFQSCSFNPDARPPWCLSIELEQLGNRDMRFPPVRASSIRNPTQYSLTIIQPNPMPFAKGPFLRILLRSATSPSAPLSRHFYPRSLCTPPSPPPMTCER